MKSKKTKNPKPTQSGKTEELHPRSGMGFRLPDRSYIPSDIIRQLDPKDWPKVSPKISLGEFACVAGSLSGENPRERAKQACHLLWEVKSAWQKSLKQAREEKAESERRAEEEKARLKSLGFDPKELEASIPHSILLKKLNLNDLLIRGKLHKGDDIWRLFVMEDAPYLTKDGHLKRYSEDGWPPGMATRITSDFRRWRKAAGDNNRPKFPRGNKNPRSKKNPKNFLPPVN